MSGSPTRRDRLPRDLTQIEMRKLELARAMAAEPQLLIADEAMAGLSPLRGRRDPRAAVPAQRAGHHRSIMIEHIMRAVMSFSTAPRRAGRRPQDRRRRAAGGRCAIPKSRGPILASSLTVAGVDAGYGAVRVLEDVSLSVGAGETVVLLGTNGNGKSTLMKCVMGMRAADRRHASPPRSTASATIWSAARPRRSSISASPGAGRPAALPQAHRRGEPAARRLPADGARGDRAQPRLLLTRPSRVLQRAAPPARRQHERRRAADAGAGARADVGAAHPADRRAVGRPGAAPGQAHDRQDQGAEGAAIS